MEKLPRLRARIAALGDFHELIRALEALAATHYRAAQEALHVSSKHLGIVTQAVQSVSSGEPLSGANAPCAQYSAGVMIAVCSEHGFVGAFNERILDRVEAELSKGETLILIGQRGFQIALERSFKADSTHAMAAHANSVPGLARQLSLATSWAESVRIVFSRHQTGRQHSVDCEVIDLGSDRPERTANDLDLPLHQLPLQNLQEGLWHDRTFATIAHCLLESLSSENATRLASMQAADRNVRDKLAQLTQRERTVRQEEITEELLDILTGVESVSA